MWLQNLFFFFLDRTLLTYQWYLLKTRQFNVTIQISRNVSISTTYVKLKPQNCKYKVHKMSKNAYYCMLNLNSAYLYINELLDPPI